MCSGLSLRGGGGGGLRNANMNVRSWGRPLLHGDGTFSTAKSWQLAVGGGWRRLAAVGGGWRRLAAVGVWQLVAVGGGWQPLAVSGWWLMVCGDSLKGCP